MGLEPTALYLGSRWPRGECTLVRLPIGGGNLSVTFSTNWRESLILLLLEEVTSGAVC